MVEKISHPQDRSMFRSYAWLIALVGLLLLIGSGMAYIFNRNWAIQTQIGAGIGVVLLLGTVLLRPEAVRSILTRRPVKYASNAIVKSLAFIGILALINFLAIKYEWAYDLTETGQFTLSEQTIQVLQTLDRPIEVIGFFQSSDPRLSLAKDYLERYSHYTNYLTYQFYDPNIEPGLVQKYNPSNYGLIFISGENHYETSGVDEQTITNGLARVANEEEDLISIRPKQPSNRGLFLTPLQTSITIFTTLIIIPAAVLIAGVGIWWKRR